MNEVETLRKELEELCKKTNTRLSGMKYLVYEYYIKSCGWDEEKALKHAISLFHGGVITQIKLIGKDGKEL